MEEVEKVEVFTYYVMVGNLGIACKTNSEGSARQTYYNYVEKSKMGFGQVGMETVRLHKLNSATNEYEVLKEYIYSKE